MASIGVLHVDLDKQVFIPVKTILGLMFVLPRKDHKLNKGAFNVSLNKDLDHLTTPVRYYLLHLENNNDVSFSGYGFLGPVPPEVLDNGLIYKYAGNRDRIPKLMYSSPEFCVYHAVNEATLISVPRIPNPIEDLLFTM
jgi:hypothetical protein